MIYFDHNATTPLHEQVLAAMLPFLHTHYGNPSSLSKMGRLARSAIDTAREHVAALVGVNAEQVIFTSGGTEANALALHCLNPQTPLAISALEHPSVTETALRLQRQGHSLQIIPVDAEGLISPATMAHLRLQPHTLVSIMLANNETGCIQNVSVLAAQLQEQGALIHTDAVQAAGKIPIDFKCLSVQRLSISSHKIYGPKGCGALVVDNSQAIEPLFVGGGQEKSRRAGTENVAAIVGFGKAAELALAQLQHRYQTLLSLRSQLEHGLASINGIKIFSQNCQRLPNTVQFGKLGVDGEMLLMLLDQQNIAVSSGSACAAEGGKPSPVLTAMGVAPDLAKSAIRISLGIQNTPAEINQFLTVLQKLL